MRCQSAWLFGLCIVAAIVSLSLSGCGVPQTEITGQVTYNGKPLDRSGTITFFSPESLPVSAAIDSSGNYHAVGVRLGENKVAVSYTRPVPPPKPGSRLPKPDKEPGSPKTQPNSPFITPAHYAVQETSGLKVVVEKNTVYSPDLEGPDIP